MNDRIGRVISSLEEFAQSHPDMWRVSACGSTPSPHGIPALLDMEAYAYEPQRVHLLIVSGFSGRDAETSLGLAAVAHFKERQAELSPKIALSAVPVCNPDGSYDLTSGYPPQDNFYNDPESPESRYLWRWTSFQAPDLLIELRFSNEVRWSNNDAANHVKTALGNVSQISDTTSLAAALGVGSPCGLAPIPSLILETPPDRLIEEMDRLWDLISAASNPVATSPARRELQSRSSRSYIEVARVLASVYGYQLDPVNYTQGVGISGRLRLAGLDNSNQGLESPVQGITSLVAQLVSAPGEIFGETASGANLAGLIWAEELADATGERRYADLIVNVADRYRPGVAGGAPPPCDPDFRTEDMFMAGAILGRAFGITGEPRYMDLLVRFLLDGDIQQGVGAANGLFWHCRSAPYYWGRGNGFAALGLTETLSYLPEGHSDRDLLLSMYRKLLDALGRIQDLSGMLPQVLDFPGSYHELTATCMYGYALARGIRQGWLDHSYQPSLDLAWSGVSQRVDNAGNVVDGCASTGVQATLKEYLERPAVFGFDDRTGGMALWFAVEMERLSRETISA